MTIKDFRRIALSMPGAEEGSHMGAVDFRVGGRIFSTLAAAKQGYGNLMLKPEQQAMFVEELPAIFIPIAGGWGRNGATHVVLANVSEDVLEGAIRTAYDLRVAANAKAGRKLSGGKTPAPAKRKLTAKTRPKKKKT
ncbi:MAG: MmcQ/YjbR family DNA-binding protein [Acidobacteria bacterium]|nr:MmcQ/YjbR family DNA-binding protein [Acidobacteriota bacterium]MBS1867774.1 MmcQ/YjbR family DNA-binding protein [Acidobacteriota bacterium]